MVSWIEVAIEVICKYLRAVISNGGAFIRPFLDSGQAHFAHQVGDQSNGADDAFVVQFSGHPAAPTSAAKKREDPADFRFQRLPASLGGRGGPGAGPPGVKRGSGNTELAAHPGNRVVVLLRENQG